MDNITQSPDLSRWKIIHEGADHFWAELDLPHDVTLKVTKMSSGWDMWIFRERAERHETLSVTTGRGEVFARMRVMVEEYIAQRQVELDEIYRAMFFDGGES